MKCRVVPTVTVWLIVSHVLLLWAPHAHAMVVCPETKLAFFHVPKTGGEALNDFLILGNNKPWTCYLVGWGISGAYGELTSDERKTKVIKLDSAHVTPAELEFWVFQGVGKLEEWTRSPGAPHMADVSPQKLVHDWNTFTVVRNPYLRVLGAYAQRQLRYYDGVWGKDYPRNDFGKFMRYLERNLVDNKTFSWCCTPSITHFRPNTLFTHWENDFPAIKTVLKLEEIDTALPRFMSRFYNHSETSLFTKNEHGNSKTRRRICHRTRGCILEDLQTLLNLTYHTEETIRITNRLYKRDFELLGYNMLLRDDGADDIKDNQDHIGHYGISVEEVEKILSPESGNNSNRTAERISSQVDLPVEGSALAWRLLAICLFVWAYREKRSNCS